MWTADLVVAVVGPVCAGGFGLLRYWLRLRFLRWTFERTGDRRDLEIAGRVTGTEPPPVRECGPDTSEEYTG